MNRKFEIFDNERAKIPINNGDYCWIKFTRLNLTGKRALFGVLKSSIYSERSLQRIQLKSLALVKHYPVDRTPNALKNPILKSFVNAILHCTNMAETEYILNRPEPEIESLIKDPFVRVHVIDAFSSALMNDKRPFRKETDLSYSKEITRCVLIAQLAEDNPPEFANSLEIGYVELNTFTHDTASVFTVEDSIEASNDLKKITNQFEGHKKAMAEFMKLRDQPESPAKRPK